MCHHCIISSLLESCYYRWFCLWPIFYASYAFNRCLPLLFLISNFIRGIQSLFSCGNEALISSASSLYLHEGHFYFQRGQELFFPSDHKYGSYVSDACSPPLKNICCEKRDAPPPPPPFPLSGLHFVTISFLICFRHDRKSFFKSSHFMVVPFCLLLR